MVYQRGTKRFYSQPLSREEKHKRQHLWTGIPMHNYAIYLRTPTPGKLFTNEFGAPSDWVVLKEGGVLEVMKAQCSRYLPDYPFQRGVSTRICLEWRMVSQAIILTDTADPESQRHARAETPRTGRDSSRMESVPQEHLGMSAQRSYGP